MCKMLQGCLGTVKWGYGHTAYICNIGAVNVGLLIAGSVGQLLPPLLYMYSTWLCTYTYMYCTCLPGRQQWCGGEVGQCPLATAGTAAERLAQPRNRLQDMQYSQCLNIMSYLQPYIYICKKKLYVT